MIQWNNPILLLIFGPMVAGILCLIVPDRLKIISRLFSFLVTSAALAGSIFVFIKKPLVVFDFFIADNLSAFVAMAVSVFAFLITIYSFGFIKKSCGRYFGYVLITLGASLGVVFANEFIILLVFWGLVAAMLYLLVNMAGTDKSAGAAKKMLIMVGGTDALMIFGIGIVGTIAGTFFMNKIKLPLKDMMSYAAYFSIAIAAFAKAGAVPFHSWLPDVAEDGPTPVTAYLPASLDKLLGIYLLARASLHIFVMNAFSNMVLLIVGSITIIMAVMIALVQHDLKRLLGYHAVSQVGYMVLGIGTGNPIGIAGGLFHMLNHAIYKSCLFLSAGCVEKNAGTTDLSKLGGLAKYMPVTFATFLIASLSISGIPPFNGFVSKWMIYQGIIESAQAKNALWPLWLTAAMFGSALTVASFMKLIHAVFLGRASEDSAGSREAGLWMLVPIVILAALCAIFGIFAFSVPLRLFILPSIGTAISYVGSWRPVIATAIIILAGIAGFIAYWLLKPGKFRESTTFVGGEEANGIEGITGAEFYNTIRDMKVPAFFYKKEEEGLFDLYSISRNIVYSVTGFFQRLHNGVLPTYMVWCLLGLAGLFLMLFLK